MVYFKDSEMGGKKNLILICSVGGLSASAFGIDALFLAYMFWIWRSGFI